MIQVIAELFELIGQGLEKLSPKNIYLTLGLAFVLSILCAIASNLYTRLWNKSFQSTKTHKILTLFAAVCTFLFVLAYVSFAFLAEIAQFQVIKWSGDLIQNKSWQDNVAKDAYYLVKKSGRENMDNFPDPTGNSVAIPISTPETLELCADYFSASACKNFDLKHPFLSKVVWSKSRLPSELVKSDVANYFGNGNIGSQQNLPVSAITNDDEFEKRIKRENGQSGQIQISLIWNNRNDLDLHCFDPLDDEIYFSKKTSASGGILDIDMNNTPKGENSSDEPVENIKWNDGDSPKGLYRIFVKHFKNHGSPDPTSYQLRLKVDDKIEIMSGEMSFGEEIKLIHSFEYGGKVINTKPPYDIKNAISLVSRTLREDMSQQAPRVVYISRILLVILFLLIQSIPFGLIGYAAYRDLKIQG